MNRRSQSHTCQVPKNSGFARPGLPVKSNNPHQCASSPRASGSGGTLKNHCYQPFSFRSSNSTLVTVLGWTIPPPLASGRKVGSKTDGTIPSRLLQHPHSRQCPRSVHLASGTGTRKRVSVCLPVITFFGSTAACGHGTVRSHMVRSPQSRGPSWRSRTSSAFLSCTALLAAVAQMRERLLGQFKTGTVFENDLMRPTASLCTLPEK